MDDNTFSVVALGILGLCIGVFLDNKINLNGGK